MKKQKKFRQNCKAVRNYKAGLFSADQAGEVEKLMNHKKIAELELFFFEDSLTDYSFMNQVQYLR